MELGKVQEAKECPPSPSGRSRPAAITSAMSGLGIDKGYSMWEAGTIHIHDNTDCLSKFKAQIEQK